MFLIQEDIIMARILDIIFGGRGDQEACGNITKLKLAIHRGTTENGVRNGDSAREITAVLNEMPHLAEQAIVLLKARIKDKSAISSKLGIELLNACMRSNGLEFLQLVQKNVLPRIRKLASPNKGVHPLVQRKAEAVIREWAMCFGKMPGLQGFLEASESAPPNVEVDSKPIRRVFGKSLSWTSKSQSSKNIMSPTRTVRLKSCSDLSSLSKLEVVELAKLSQKAILDKIIKTNDAETIRSLTMLHDQLAEDIAHYYSSRSATD